MNKKIISIFICMLMCATVFVATGDTNTSEEEVPTAAMDVRVVNNHLSRNIQNFGLLDKGATCFAENLHDNNNLVCFDSDVPGTFNVISGSTAGDFLAGGCFVDDVWFACEYSTANSNIWCIDETTGAMTLVGPSGTTLNGIAYDDAAEILYGCGSTNLYYIDTTTGASTLVGPLGNSGGLMIGIACDSNGNMYGEDIGDDYFYSINTATGAATVIGSLGIDLNYAQDMAYDKENDICYITGYKGSANGGGALHWVDLTTGQANFIGDFPIGSLGVPSEVACFGIPYSGGPPPIVPDLECDGVLNWEDITPGATVIGSFTVENVGDAESLLDWEIESYPDWGNWTLTPMSGLDLTPEDGAFTINVEVVAPDEGTEFTGEIKIVNSENASDYCVIDATMTDVVSQSSMISQFFEILAARFPIIATVLGIIF